MLIYGNKTPDRCIYWVIGKLSNKADLVWLCPPPGLLSSAGCGSGRGWGWSVSTSDWMSASSVWREEVFLGVFVSLGELLLRLVELELTTLLVRGRDWSSELVLQEEKEELLCFLQYKSSSPPAFLVMDRDTRHNNLPRTRERTNWFGLKSQMVKLLNIT